MYSVYLKKNEEKNILNGFAFIYANEVKTVLGKDKQGSIAKVYSFDGRFLGIGYINHYSKILVRLLSNKEETVDREFYFNRIKKANDYRLELGYSNNYRAVFSESDMLPGLIVDKYGDYLSVQFLSLGMDVVKDVIVSVLVDIFNPKGIYERSDSPIREKEGLKQIKGVLYGGDFNPVVEIIENGLKILVDLENGQKTGYFLDQKENRDNLKYYVKDKTVLDCFCNVGGFSLCASLYGAKEILSVDISENALDYVRHNAKLNNIDNIKTLNGAVFSVLRELKANKEKFGVVILDPPAFTKSNDTVKQAIKGYKDINILGLKLVEKGGYLITCSCSQHLGINAFIDMINQSVFESGVSAKMVELRFQGKDHATKIGTEQSLYLKVAVLKII